MNCDIELVDPTLSEFNGEEVKRVIGVALLCTQASPMLRPPMSRVVAMLSVDIEVTTVTTTPGYLTNWKYNDTSTTSMTRTSKSQPDSINLSIAVDVKDSPAIATPTLYEIIGE